MFEDCFDDVLTRLLLLERLAVEGTKNAVPFFVFWQSTFPYWTNRLGAISPVRRVSGNATRDVVITMRLVVGHLTENLQGTNERGSMLQGARVSEYFERYRHLNPPEYPDVPRGLDPRGCSISLPRGESFFLMAQAVTQIGVEFDLTIPFSYTID